MTHCPTLATILNHFHLPPADNTADGLQEVCFLTNILYAFLVTPNLLTAFS
jgi:hypothetical protein